MTTVGIVDDHPLFRSGLRNLLTAHGIDVLGEAPDLAGAAALLDLAPDVVIVDVHLPDGSGLEVLQLMGSRPGSMRALVLSMTSDTTVAARALALGAQGYLVKDSSPEEVVAAVRALAAGSTVVGSTIAHRLHGLSQHASYTPSGTDFPQLTTREREVLGLVADGLTNAEVASAVGVSEKTIANYVSSLLATLHARDRRALAELVRRAADHAPGV